MTNNFFRLFDILLIIGFVRRLDISSYFDNFREITIKGEKFLVLFNDFSFRAISLKSLVQYPLSFRYISKFNHTISVVNINLLGLPPIQ